MPGRALVGLLALRDADKRAVSCGGDAAAVGGRCPLAYTWQARSDQPGRTRPRLGPLIASEDAPPLAPACSPLFAWSRAPSPTAPIVR